MEKASYIVRLQGGEAGALSSQVLLDKVGLSVSDWVIENGLEGHTYAFIRA